MEVLKVIDQYREGMIIKFDKLLSVPFVDRLPALMQTYGEEKIHVLVTVMLMDFCNNYNVVRPMNAGQIVSCAYEIMHSSKEDYLSVEDLAVFFHGAKQGKYGRILDHIDNHIIFEMLNEYRDQRHREYMRIKESQHLEVKALGTSERTTANNPMEEAMYNMTGRLNDMKQRLKEQREINLANKL